MEAREVCPDGQENLSTTGASSTMSAVFQCGRRRRNRP